VKSTKNPCRLSVYLARDARVGAVLRRGPSAWAQLARWDRDTNQIEPGQWFHGRVYERRCDLSPDGRLFVYFAAKHGRRDDADDIGEAWTAISRLPYFTALTLWTNLGSWYGGGMFEGDRKVLLDASCTQTPHPKFRPHKLKVRPCPWETAPWEQRLLRDGWRLVERGFDPRNHWRVGEREIWEKPHPDLDLKLCRQVEDIDFDRYGGPYGDTYWLETGDDLTPLPRVAWADWDTPERLVFVRAGVLLQGTWTGKRLKEEVLFDFNPLRPAEVSPPPWAQRW